eukprot:GHVS01052580.1.p1 GENE.GHVS01052580.1~~GHVS01052580.1.p1  ORF type:complete len:225 (+),score=14.05 GHVS01052580.1:256-930(+)
MLVALRHVSAFVVKQIEICDEAVSAVENFKQKLVTEFGDADEQQHISADNAACDEGSKMPAELNRAGVQLVKRATKAIQKVKEFKGKLDVVNREYQRSIVEVQRPDSLTYSASYVLLTEDHGLYNQRPSLVQFSDGSAVASSYMQMLFPGSLKSSGCDGLALHCLYFETVKLMLALRPQRTPISWLEMLSDALYKTRSLKGSADALKGSNGDDLGATIWGTKLP